MTADVPVTALIHDDGHVLMAANHGTAVEELRGFAWLLGEAGVTGWQVVTMDADAATAAGMAREGCAVCGPWLPCGCGVGAAFAGHCPHGSRDGLIASRDELGWA